MYNAYFGGAGEKAKELIAQLGSMREGAGDGKCTAFSCVPLLMGCYGCWLAG